MTTSGRGSRPNNSKGDEYGRQVWNEWCTDQFAWLALEWLVREGNIRAPQYVKIDPEHLSRHGAGRSRAG